MKYYINGKEFTYTEAIVHILHMVSQDDFDVLTVANMAIRGFLSSMRPGTMMVFDRIKISCAVA